MKQAIRQVGVWTALISSLLLASLPASSVLAAPTTTTPSAAAAANNSGQALEIAPPVLSLSGNPGQVVKAQISLRDISSTNLLVNSQVNDFVAAGEDGTPKILLDNKEANPYSLRTWITTPTPLLLVPRQIKTLPVTIAIPASASPGGHYGVVRFTATPPDLKGTGVSLSASLGSLLLLTVNGPTTEKMSVAELSVSHNGKSGTVLEAAPLQFTERIHNSGNIFEQPTGQVSVTDMFGKKIGAVNVNVPPRNVLPQSIRKFTQPFDSTVIGNKKLFGHYKADLSLTYGASKQILTSSVSFWVIPYKLIAIAVVGIVGGFFILRTLIKQYNQQIINRAQGGTKTKKKK